MQELDEEMHKEPFDIATLSAYKFSCCVVVYCFCLHQLCCFHVVLLVFMCCVVVCCSVQSKLKVQLPEGSLSKKYKVGFTCTCCSPGKELAKTAGNKVYKQFQQQ